MNKLALAAASLTAASLAGLVGPASAQPLPEPQTITSSDVQAVYPAMHHPQRDDRRQRVWVPKGCTKQVRSHVVGRNVSIYDFDSPAPEVSATYMRLGTRASAKSMMRRYRNQARACQGHHESDGGASNLWGAHWRISQLGDETVGLKLTTEDRGGMTLTREVTFRKGRTVVDVVIGTEDAGTAVAKKQAARMARIIARKVR